MTNGPDPLYEIQHRLMQRFPRVGATLEYYFRPGSRTEFGEAFSGQRVRQTIVCDILHEIECLVAIETGTFRGATTEFLAKRVDGPVHTVEITPVHYHFARRRLRRYRNVEQAFGDSREFLRRLADDPSVPKTRAFFYLDAHWDEDDLPLAEEVSLAIGTWKDSVIMIDDFEVPGLPGYRFDDYGPGKRLCVEYLHKNCPAAGPIYFPTVSPQLETGGLRGYAVLGTTPPAVAVLDRIGDLGKRPVEGLLP